MTDWVIRDALPGDAARIAEIYAPYVRNTAISFEDSPPDANEIARRMSEYQRRYPYIVMVENGRVTGYAYASKYRERAAYSPTAELSVYVDDAFLGGGRGRALVSALIARLKADKRVYTLLSCVATPNPRSEHLFLSLGFKPVGGIENAGWKLGKWHNIAYFALALRAFDIAPDYAL